MDLNRDTHLDHSEWENFTKADVLRRCVINEVDDVIEIIEGDALKQCLILKQHNGKKF